MQIQIFTPISVAQINAWLAENPRIDVKGFSLAAAADVPDAPHPLSICAILYEPPATLPGVSAAVAAEVEELIEEVAIRAPVPPLAPPLAPPTRIDVEGEPTG
jgi:hypothetical protein